jgi:hypothetical protein
MGMGVNINGQTKYTSEVLQDDGSYGSSCEYIYWFDVADRQHCHFFTGGQIIHVSDQPLAIKNVIINAEKVVLTGSKVDAKVYTRHTGYPGGQRFTSPKELLNKHPERIIKMAVKGMLPKNKLGRAINGNLFVYAGTQHPHEAQQPKQININSLK